jgi:hypothetical protein
MRTKTTTLFFTLALAIFFVAGLVLATSAVAAPTVPNELVASGLNNPRGLAFGPDGTLYVAEAGTGGDGACVPAGVGNPHCYGPSGSVSRINTDGTQERFATGLPSIADQTLPPPPNGTGPGGEALGPHDIVVDSTGGMTISIGFAFNPVSRTVLGPAGANMAQLASVASDGTWAATTDIGAYEVANNPDANVVDSNPFGLLLRSDGVALADAGGNTLYHVANDNTISVVSTFDTRDVEFPPGSNSFIPMHAVPTTVLDAGPTAYYVGQLTGFPFPQSGANVYHVTEGVTPTVHLGGFTNIIDIAHDGSGGLYVLQISMNGLAAPGGPVPGALIHVADDGTRTTLATDGLVFPGGVAVGPDGVYVTNYSAFAGIGEVVRIPFEPTSVDLTSVSGGPVAWLAPLAALVLAAAAIIWLTLRRRLLS